jgi:hypothetical protein
LFSVHLFNTYLGNQDHHPQRSTASAFQLLRFESAQMNLGSWESGAMQGSESSRDPRQGPRSQESLPSISFHMSGEFASDIHNTPHSASSNGPNPSRFGGSPTRESQLGYRMRSAELHCPLVTRAAGTKSTARLALQPQTRRAAVCISALNKTHTEDIRSWASGF